MAVDWGKVGAIGGGIVGGIIGGPGGATAGAAIGGQAGGAVGGKVSVCAGENAGQVAHVLQSCTPTEAAEIQRLYLASSKSARAKDSAEVMAHAIAGGDDCINSSAAGQAQAAYWRQLAAKYPLPAGGWANTVPQPAQAGGGASYYPGTATVDGLTVQAPRSPAVPVPAAAAGGLSLLPILLGVGAVGAFLLMRRG